MMEVRGGAVSMATGRRCVSTENGCGVESGRQSFEPIWAAESVLNASRVLVSFCVFIQYAVFQRVVVLFPEVFQKDPAGVLPVCFSSLANALIALQSQLVKRLC